MGWIILIIVAVLLFKNASKILTAITNFFQNKADALDAKSPNNSNIQNRSTSGVSNLSSKKNYRLSSTIRNNNALISQIAGLIVKESNPFVVYLQKNYPDINKAFLGFYPLAFICDVFDTLSIDEDRALVYALQKEVENLEMYSNYTSNTTSYDDAQMLRMAWSDAIYHNYTEAKQKDREQAIPMVFVKLLAATAVKDGKIDEELTGYTGSALRSFENDLTIILRENGINC